eukprot:TRINITY_DN10871_c0_g1_i1.p1 TRINITY_DN10871_c0_g1~~TRINITY_DN10871_c0_g1_i1.p1  ORF type:complete len:118 (+),score=16.28 TRINITY_DN10871_c0_g1_i1:463-816(+)
MLPLKSSCLHFEEEREELNLSIEDMSANFEEIQKKIQEMRIRKSQAIVNAKWSYLPEELSDRLLFVLDQLAEIPSLSELRLNLSSPSRSTVSDEILISIANGLRNSQTMACFQLLIN